MIGDAVLSPDGVYRYELTRVVNEYGHKHWPRIVCWVMLNPSTADATEDDPTIRRVKDFTERWGYTAARVINLFALRTPYPDFLSNHIQAYGEESARGPENSYWHRHAITNSALTICAWGAMPEAVYCADKFRAAHKAIKGGAIYCLGLTKYKAPKHPLYLPKSSEPILF